jgi:hypothetical protein
MTLSKKKKIVRYNFVKDKLYYFRRCYYQSIKKMLEKKLNSFDLDYRFKRNELKIYDYEQKRYFSLHKLEEILTCETLDDESINYLLRFVNTEKAHQKTEEFLNKVLWAYKETISIKGKKYKREEIFESIWHMRAIRCRLEKQLDVNNTRHRPYPKNVTNVINDMIKFIKNELKEVDEK